MNRGALCTYYKWVMMEVAGCPWLLDEAVICSPRLPSSVVCRNGYAMTRTYQDHLLQLTRRVHCSDGFGCDLNDENEHPKTVAVHLHHARWIQTANDFKLASQQILRRPTVYINLHLLNNGTCVCLGISYPPVCSASPSASSSRLNPVSNSVSLFNECKNKL